MNSPEFYNAIQGDYTEIKNLVADEIIEELVLEFLADASFIFSKKSPHVFGCVFSVGGHNIT